MREPFIGGRGDRAASELEEADGYDPVSVFRVPRQAAHARDAGSISRAVPDLNELRVGRAKSFGCVPGRGHRIGGFGPGAVHTGCRGEKGAAIRQHPVFGVCHVFLHDG